MKGFSVLIFITILSPTLLALPSTDTKGTKKDTTKDSVVITPDSGQEFVFVQSSGAGARPVARKDKTEALEVGGGPFETAHKVPSKLTFARSEDDEELKGKGKKVHKRQAPAPAGAIKLDIKKLLAKYQTELKTSSTTTSKPRTTTTRVSRRRTTTKARVKKEARVDKVSVTSPRPILTTAKTHRKDDDEGLAEAPSGKQRSRIQIKKGPNGQEYEYEYVYYYYDDEDDSKDKNKIVNGHDGPAKHQISAEKATPEANEILPSRGSKTRGRQLGEEETVNEERLPANTRFPPRSRNLNTTPLPEEEVRTTRGRGRGKPNAEGPVYSENDNVSDETQGNSRGRTRANVRRPSLDLVDNDSFNSAGAAGGTKPNFPSQLPEGPVRFLGAIPNERIDLSEPQHKGAKQDSVKPVNEPSEDDNTFSSNEETTTTMSPMEKVALDLYAISQGTQKLFGEEGESSTDDARVTADGDGTTILTTTESSDPETTPTPTTTSTTTTTTPAPTTTTTTTTEAPAGPFGRGKFGGARRPGGGRKGTQTTTTTTEATQEPTKRGKFGRPSFGGARGRGKGTSTHAPAVHEENNVKEEKGSQSRVPPRNSRFGTSRPRGRTTTASSESAKEESTTSATTTHHRPQASRARPGLNLRPRGRGTTTVSPTGEAKEESSPAQEISSTTVRSRKVNSAPGIRPLRPGPRINLNGRGRGSSTTTTEASAGDHVTGDDEHETTQQEASEKDETSGTAADNGPLSKLKNKGRLNVQARPKPAASAPVQVRRVNPLLGRRRLGQTTETAPAAPSSETPEPATDPAEEAAETDAPSSTTTTEEPRGLNRLLAGRKRLGQRTPGTLG